jgi:aminomuconate-semialdehyde/2-hydroxymuconate-6-semialdehyde dehydrogenase
LCSARSNRKTSAWRNHFRFRTSSAGNSSHQTGGEYLDNIEPATGKPYSQVADSDTRDVELAVAAAAQAFPGWSRTSAAERSRILLRIAEFIERDLETLARAESIDTGKPLSLARNLDIPRAASNFRFFATAICTLNRRRTSPTTWPSTTRCVRHSELSA